MTISGRSDLDDDDFYDQAIQWCKTIFMHCYHDGNMALIPQKGAYAHNFNSAKYGDLLVSMSPERNIVFNFTTKREY